MSTSELFLFLEPGTDPATDRLSTEHEGARTDLVWVPDGPTAAAVAAERAAAGVGLVELYRGFDLRAAAAVLDAVDGRAAVGVASHLPGSPAPGRVQRSATVFAGPSAEPVTRQHGDGRWTTTVPAPDAGSTVAVARELAARGAQLVEICGGTPLSTAALVREALDPSVVVSLVTFPYDSLEAVADYLRAFADAG